MEKSAFERFGTALSAFTPIFQPRQQRDNHEMQKGVLNDPATRNSRREKHRAVTANRPMLSVASISFSRIRRMHTLFVPGSSRPVNQYNRCCPTVHHAAKLISFLTQSQDGIWTKSGRMLTFYH